MRVNIVLTSIEARRQIVEVANQVHRANGHNASPFTLRHLQRAVHVVRQAQAVPVKVLLAAGFNAEARR